MPVPKSQRFDALFCQKFLPLGVALHSIGMTVLRAVQFHGQFCIGAVDIQNMISDRVLSAEFETGKTPSAQRPPERLFVIRLVAAELAGDVFEAHVGRMFFAGNTSSPAHVFSLSSLNEERAGVRSQVALRFSPLCQVSLASG